MAELIFTTHGFRPFGAPVPDVPMVMSMSPVRRTAYCGTSTMSLAEVATTVSADVAGDATMVNDGAGWLSGDGT